ncbi:ABC transporter ATP-binding protein [Streptomyces sp. JNUCC 64]
MAIVEVSELRKTYGEKRAVDGVSFTVEEGEVFGILGPNGAGKTTTVECVEGLRRPDGGSVRVAGYDPAAERDPVTRILGVQLQESGLQPKITVREAFGLYAACYPDPADWRVLAERLGLTEKLRTRFAKLSGGQKQRLAIALALIGRPRIVVLDELTTGLDPRARRDTWQLVEDVRDSGVTVLLVTHFMEEADRLCDRIALVDKGRITALDTPAGLIGRTTGGTAVSFVPSAPLDTRLLTALPPVRSVTRQDGRIVVNGTDETAHAVLSLLAGRGVSAHRLRVTGTTLDDAYLDLTGPDA